MDNKFAGGKYTEYAIISRNMFFLLVLVAHHFAHVSYLCNVDSVTILNVMYLCTLLCANQRKFTCANWLRAKVQSRGTQRHGVCTYAMHRKPHMVSSAFVVLYFCFIVAPASAAATPPYVITNMMNGFAARSYPHVRIAVCGEQQVEAQQQQQQYKKIWQIR